MEHHHPESEPETRPAATFEDVPAIKKWLIGIAIVSLVGVLTLLMFSGNEKKV